VEKADKLRSILILISNKIELEIKNKLKVKLFSVFFEKEKIRYFFFTFPVSSDFKLNYLIKTLCLEFLPMKILLSVKISEKINGGEKILKFREKKY
jgi:hypothetical protein